VQAFRDALSTGGLFACRYLSCHYLRSAQCLCNLRLFMSVCVSLDLGYAQNLDFKAVVAAGLGGVRSSAIPDAIEANLHADYCSTPLRIMQAHHLRQPRCIRPSPKTGFRSDRRASTGYREREYLSMQTLAMFVSQVLSDDRSCRSVVSENVAGLGLSR